MDEFFFRNYFPLDYLREAEVRNQVINCLLNIKPVHQRCEGRTILHDAARHIPGYMTWGINGLLSKDAEINAVDNEGNSVLHEAVKNPRLSVRMINNLLAWGAYPDYRDKKYYPPLGYSRSAAVSKLLIQYTIMEKFDEIIIQNNITDKTVSTVHANKLLNLSFCESPNQQLGYSLYRNTCIAEIMEMRTDCIADNYTVYDFASTHYSRRVWTSSTDSYINRIIIINKVLLRLHRGEYPCCQDLLITSIKLNDYELLKRIFQQNMYATRKSDKKRVVLNYQCVDALAFYLTRDDIVNVILAYPEKLNIYGGQNSRRS